MDKSNEIERLEEELRAHLDRAAALAADIERAEAVQDDAEDEHEIVAAFSAGQAARNRLKKVEPKITATRERLARARDEDRAKLRAKLRADVQLQARALIVKARETQAVLARFLAAGEALQTAGFRAEFASVPAPPALNGSLLTAPALLDRFEAALDAMAQGPSAGYRRLASPAKAAPRPQALPMRPAGYRSPEHSPAPAAKLLPAPRPRLREAAAEGAGLYLVARPGMALPGRGQLAPGDVVALTDEEARPFYLKSIVTPVTADDVARLDASDAFRAPKAKPDGLEDLAPAQVKEATE